MGILGTLTGNFAVKNAAWHRNISGATEQILEFNNCPTRCDLFSLLYFCRQLYMFRV